MVASVHDQLKSAFHQTQVFSEIVDDYLQCAQKLREVQVRNAQLDREAGELRLENDTLLRAVEEASRSTASPAELEQARKHATELQADLVSAYKEKGDAAESRAQALQQLEVVREMNAQQAVVLEDASQERQRLLDEIKSLRAAVVSLTAAQELINTELETRTAEMQSAQYRAIGLESENSDLTNRLLLMNDHEIERMTATQQMCDDMVQDARRQAAEVLAVARANLAQEAAAASAAASSSGGGVSGGAFSMDDSMRKLNIAAEAVGGASLPAAVQHCHPAVHPGGIYAFAMDERGATLASCGADKVVRLWDVARCNATAVLRGAHETVNDVAFTLDGRLILGAEDRSAVRIWDCRTARIINRALTGHTGKVTGVSVSPSDADTIVTAATDRSLKLWQLATGTCTRTFRFPSTARRVTVLPDSGLIVAGYVDGNLRFWDPRTPHPHPVQEVDLHRKGIEICSVVASLGGGTVVTCGRDSSMCVVDTRAFVLRSRLSAAGFSVAQTPWATPALSPSASHVVAGSEDGSLFLWELNGAGGNASSSSAIAGTISNRGGGGSSSGSTKAFPRALRHPRSASKEQQDAAIVACAWSPAGMPVVTGDRLGGVTFWMSQEKK